MLKMDRSKWSLFSFSTSASARNPIELPSEGKLFEGPEQRHPGRNQVLIRFHLFLSQNSSKK
jgi:hypothetical protein